jgi:hypothetical protein
MLGFHHFNLKSSCNPLIEDYTKAFYMIHEGDFPSIQLDVSVRWFKSMKEIDGPSHIFIDFNVPAHASCLN